MHKETVAYFAGLIDGEGSITIEQGRPSTRGKNPRYVAYISVYNNDGDVLKEGQAIFGGYLMKRFRGKRYPQFIWKMGARIAEKALVALLPYLRIKRENALNALSLYKYGRDAYFNNGKRSELSPLEVKRRRVLWRNSGKLNVSGRKYRAKPRNGKV